MRSVYDISNEIRQLISSELEIEPSRITVQPFPVINLETYQENIDYKVILDCGREFFLLHNFSEIEGSLEKFIGGIQKILTAQ